ncbi:hypothetical protein Nepgr_003919 [Nepenthes gracilis]|uniref:Uncharacterized protein n=1 Tax=Nepenthes gracilis TaxID=150966 RepID=A0AAD3S0E5_NEPGR|nr:hypothetical protein Nepgr_003919 [Nepenthes gracilis]
MDYAWVCVEIAGDAPLPEKVKIKVENLKENSDCQFADICFHYQWKPNQHKLPAQKGPEVIRKHPSGSIVPRARMGLTQNPLLLVHQLVRRDPFREIGREGSCVGVAQGSDKEDQSPLTKNGTVIHTTMVMEPLGEKFTCNDCPASGSDVSDGANGNLVSSSGQNAQWNTPSIQDRLSATSTAQIRASCSPIEGESSECLQRAEDPDLTKVDRDPTHFPVPPLHCLLNRLLDLASGRWIAEACCCPALWCRGAAP